MRSGQDQAMERVVQTQELCVMGLVANLPRPVHLVGEGVELLDLLLRDLARRELRGVGLEHRAEHEELVDVLLRPGSHMGPLVRDELDQVLRVEPAQRLADGRAADPELCGQLLLLEP